MTWFVLEVTSGREPAAVENLYMRGFHAYVPVQDRKVLRSRHSKARVSKIFSMFPGYAFVDDRGRAVDWERLLATTLVSGVLQLAGTDTPAPLPPKEAWSIMNAEIEDPTPSPNMLKGGEFVAGDQVRIVHGLLQGDIPVPVVEIKQETAAVLMSVMGQLRPVEIALEDLEKA